ncbi:MAG: DUF3037 domain-containing protein [Mesorhizobium sp.]
MAHTYDYAIVRVVPRVERGEFINAGVIVSCPGAKLLDCGFDLDAERLKALDPSADIEAIRQHLAAFERICRGGRDSGPIGELPVRQRFHWLTAPRSSVIQTSPAHTGRAVDAENVVERLLDSMVRVRR